MKLLDLFRSKLSLIVDKFVSQIKAFAWAFLPKLGAAVEVAIEDLAEVALQAVLEQAPKAVKGEVKFEAAVATVVAAVTASGKKIAIQTAQAAVQLAYLEAQKVAQGK